MVTREWGSRRKVTREWGSRRKVTRDSHAVLQGHRGKDRQTRFISPHSHTEFWVWDPPYLGCSLSWMWHFQLCDFRQVT